MAHVHTCTHVCMLRAVWVYITEVFPAKQSWEGSVWCSSQGSADQGRKEVALDCLVRACEGVMRHLLHSSCSDLDKGWEENGNMESTLSPCALRLEELWETERQLNPLSVDALMLPVWPGDLPQSQTHSVRREDCNWWIPRFFLLWADVEPWDIYTHVGTGVW